MSWYRCNDFQCGAWLRPCPSCGTTRLRIAFKYPWWFISHAIKRLTPRD